MHFISPKILNAWAILAIWNSDVNILQDYFFQNGGQSPMGNDFNKHFIILLLFSPFYIFDFEASALNWSHVFHKVWYLWKWSVLYVTAHLKCFAYLIIPQNNAHTMFLKHPMGIWAPLHSKRAVYLNTRNVCIKLYPSFCYLLLLFETILTSEKMQ